MALPNIYFVLLLFVADVADFRSIMRWFECVISGSTALFFLQCMRRWQPRDLDMYILKQHFLAVIRHIIRFHDTRLEYILGRSGGPYDTGPYGFKGFLRLTRLQTPYGVIKVMESARNCALYPISWFWTTLVMNYFDADSWGVAYPVLTLRSRGLYYGHDIKEKTAQAQEKYITQGYELGESARQWADLELSCEPGCMCEEYLCLSQVSMLQS
ncbi:hypothetical protein OBBRIDRAFT_741928 [Obba rivulosa]|uniref:Uncharacterized protein n=1 Tax=Obba rivulosa TaxID=1052685 RepID=A0A8E2AGX5_9APHY|nr:hypothetical protein OBBRIDRAFT_741928 [Obba rivulosa]